MEKVFEKLGIQIPSYNEKNDPVKATKEFHPDRHSQYIEWTQSSEKAKKLQKLADAVDQEWKEKRKQKKTNSYIATSESNSNTGTSSQVLECKEEQDIVKEDEELLSTNNDLLPGQDEDKEE